MLLDASQNDSDALPATLTCSNDYNGVMFDGDPLEVHHMPVARWTLGVELQGFFKCIF